jgi:SAM-dependent methyltransferase
MINSPSKCPACFEKTSQVFLKRSHVPGHQNQVHKTVASAVNAKRGELEMSICGSCGFVYNRAFDSSVLSYDASYDNTQTCSSTFLEHVNERIDYLLEKQNARTARIVEVGCGKGGFLTEVVRRGTTSIGTGFDPTYVGPESTVDGRVKFSKTFYDLDAANTPADIVICRHVIEHVPEPIELLRNVRQALESSPHAKVFFETPCVEWILKNQVIWDFFYEHCSIFTLSSLGQAFERAGFEVTSATHVFGGQYLWLEATPTKNPVIHKDANVGKLVKLAHDFEINEEKNIATWKNYLSQVAKSGPIALWGAGAKGVSLANLVDPKRELIDCIIDLNPSKQGAFLPGTGHPITSAVGANLRGVKTAVLTNPNYRTENARLLDHEKLSIKIAEDHV